MANFSPGAHAMFKIGREILNESDSFIRLLMNSIEGNACLEKPLNHKIKQYFEGKFIVLSICKESIHNALTDFKNL